MSVTTDPMRDAASSVEDKVYQTHITARSARCKRRTCDSLELLLYIKTGEHAAPETSSHVCREMDARKSSTWVRRRQICFMREKSMGSNRDEGPTQKWPVCKCVVASFDQPCSA